MNLDLYCAIVNDGLGRKVVKILKNNGVKGATLFKGKGTINDKIAAFLGLNDIKKDIVISGCDQETGDRAILEVYKQLKLSKPNRGICFSVPLEKIIGSSFYHLDNNIKKNEEDNMEYKLISVIVDRGNGESVVDAASKAGANGATIINARGSGIHETQKVFNIEIEPEKEIVIILVKSSIVDQITEAVRQDMKIDEPGKGIIFVLDVRQTYGLYQG
ncbi:MAG TPA: P-II family nitrogen regulator [Bacilli bacterium]